MGSGASSMGMEDIIATTIVIGRAISAVTFPGMHRAYDFHSNKAPKLKNSQPFPAFIGFGSGMTNALSDSFAGDDDDNISPDPSLYQHMFSITIDGDKVYLEDPTFINDDGWTVLHTCCMSFNTAQAGLAIIDEFERLGADFDAKTLSGPGSFNRGWTALHMACAYGVEPIVAKLLSKGANPNTSNCFGYTPLLEACHRGFVNIVGMLLAYKVDLNYIPPEHLSVRSPFINAPAQAALAEAARSGFPKICQLLLDAGADRNISNSLKWTALHEACFYNRIETVKTLLLGGSDSTRRTRSGALPYHLSGLAVVRTMLKEMGGPEAVPEKGDDVDMVEILRELTLPDVDLDEDENGDIIISDDQVNNNLTVTAESNYTGDADNYNEQKNNKSKVKPRSSPKMRQSPGSRDNANDDYDSKSGPNALLHSGAMLGDLPALSTTGSSSGTKYRSPTGAALSEALRIVEDDDDDSSLQVNKDLSLLLQKARAGRRKKNDKSFNQKSLFTNGNNTLDQKYTDVPKEFLCELCQKPMSDPVETIYGNIFDRTSILGWMKQSGHICPISGGPLAESDLRPMEELRLKISKWILQKSMNEELQSNPSINSNVTVASQRESQPPSLAPEKTALKNSPNTVLNSSNKPLDSISNKKSSIVVPANDDNDDLYEF